MKTSGASRIAHRASLGLARSEVVVGVVCVLLAVAIALPVLNRNRRNALSLKDRSNLVEIHQSWVIYAGDFKGRFPVPGLINRLAADLDGDGVAETEVNGLGPENAALNTTANLYSATVAMNYLSPPVLVSPLERNPVVTEYGNYDYTAYDPTKDSYWDPTFLADLETGSNVSYAHRPIVGMHRVRHWPGTDPAVALLGNRGPADGNPRADLSSCQPDGSWTGRFVFADGHVETISATEGLRVDLKNGDNPFNYDPGLQGIDQVVAFTKQASEVEAVLQHD